jgi:hypothetical protein
MNAAAPEDAADPSDIVAQGNAVALCDRPHQRCGGDLARAAQINERERLHDHFLPVRRTIAARLIDHHARLYSRYIFNIFGRDHPRRPTRSTPPPAAIGVLYEIGMISQPAHWQSGSRVDRLALLASLE